jgi:hypothetical protein
MHPERVVIVRVAAVVAAVVTIITIIAVAAIGASGSHLLGHLFPIVQIIVFPSSGRPRAQDTIIGIVAPHSP